ncbi:glycerophosphodiester phosphodiesterase [Desulfosoma caldarium]|uniref:Glycerophosphoryl diester phosphodiesterase n=1 Tax=Desulfosoma caldarium TaxID=610254 RepID=A0A3N1UR13_9BACT|nr:glycerophosphodiester phosphodiesterase family protein [Desulfosoma caldarium]ROQ91130.1 glycerophosphoryl diester phosphodiesterase [Desulfosoma caldarium]
MVVWKDLVEFQGLWIGAHRGGAALGPENTLETAMLGFQAGAHFWELDVQLSADGVPVVIHDETLARTTDAPVLYPQRRPWSVWDFTQAELETFAAIPGVWRIPTLREALAVTRRLQWLVNVEIKGRAEHHDRLVRETLALITELDMVPRVLLSSFHLGVLRRCREMHQEVKLGVVVKEAVKDPVRLVQDVKAFSFHPAQRHLRRETVRRCREAGVPVIAWTVNDAASAQKLHGWGVSAVISDRPHELIEQETSKEDASSW